MNYLRVSKRLLPVTLIFLLPLAVISLPTKMETDTALFGIGEFQAPLRSPIPDDLRNAVSGHNITSLDDAALVAKNDELRARIIKNPSDPYLLHEFGTITFHLKSEREAIALWTAANKQDANLAPANLMLEIHRFYVLLKSGDTLSSKTLLEKIEKRFKASPHFHLIRAEQAMRFYGFKEARKSYEKAYKIAPKLYVTSLNLGRFMEFMRVDSAKVLELYKIANQLAPKRQETWLFLGNLQARLNHEQEALKTFRGYVSLVQSGMTAEKLLANVYRATGKYELAEQWYLTALKQSTSNKDSAGIRQILGDLYLQMGRLDDARSQIETVLALSETPQMVFALATIDEAQGKTVAAEKQYRRVLELVPGNALAANNLAMLLIKENRSLTEALKLSEVARSNIADNAIIESTYGCALSLTSRHAEAVTILGLVLAGANNKDSWARFCFGTSLAELGRTEEAKAIYQRLLDDDQNFKRRADVEKALKRLK